MRLEATFTKDDLQKVVAQFVPMRMRLGDNGELSLDGPSEVSLVADKGIRIVCSAKLTWPVLGFDVPITIHSVGVMVHPFVQERPEGAALVFTPQIHHADVAMVPAMLDERVTGMVNEELAKKHIELAWNFERTLSHDFPLPAALETTSAFGLRVIAGAVRVSDVALRFAVSFRTEVQRRVEGEEAPSGPSPEAARDEGDASPVGPRTPDAPSSRAIRPVMRPAFLAVPGAITAVAVAVAYALGRGAGRRRR